MNKSELIANAQKNGVKVIVAESFWFGAYVCVATIPVTKLIFGKNKNNG